MAKGKRARKREVIEVDGPRLEALLERAQSNRLRQEDTQLLGNIFQSYSEFFRIVEDKNTTLARLRKLLFGSSSEKARDILGEGSAKKEWLADSSESGAQNAAESGGQNAAEESAELDEVEEEKRAAGHGRNSADDYAGAAQVEVKHPTLGAGDSCPDCGQGTLYQNAPSVLVRFIGQAPLQATVYRLEKFRCHLCGKVFATPAPAEVGDQKYDHTAASMIGLLKYGSGLPFNRLQRLQRSCQIPLPASTQWEIVEAASHLLRPAYEELIRQAAQGEVLYNDDTHVRILELMGKRWARRAPADHEEDSKRTGLFTSGIVSTLEGIRVALYFSGRQHAGENLSDVLKARVQELSAPIQMCDGLSRNLPGELGTIVANCLSHARRKFVDVVNRFPEECEYVIEALKLIYRNDKTARKKKLSAGDRLLYHQRHSQAPMDQLQSWLQRQLADKRVEPNSALGEAIKYMLKHWEPLTLFLRQAGAPLDNNLCERALKKAILHRKNALFYRSRRGSLVGDMFMTLIYSCELNGIDAFEYLNELQLHADAAASSPGDWMPWTYQAGQLALAVPADRDCGGGEVRLTK
jgi:transposase